MADSVKLNVRRYDPSVDAEPYYQEFEIPWQDDGETDFMSVLQALCYAYENEDQIAFDMNCGNGWCGRCAMMIDGKPRLACWTKAEKGATYTLEPLAGLPVIKDLVVDKRTTYQKYVDTDVAVQSSKPMTTLVDIDHDFFYNTLSKLNTCRECMCCYAACPKVSGGLKDIFVGPGAMMQIAMRHLDPNDEADRVWQAVFSGLFECDLCGECSTACPATIDIVGLMNELQKAASARGLSGNSAYIPPSMAATAQAIAEMKAAAEGEVPASSSASIDEIIAASCDTSGCHSAYDVLAYKADLEAAQLRVNSHVASQVDLTEEQKQAFVEMFTE